ncbi:MAG: DUF4203 domain-containing protein [Phycisphaerae bacterium]|nr:DUF4203 domain-containing protein [Phycisphaerae bacterium]
MTAGVRIVLGLLVLLLGRRLYWIMVGISGFLAGSEFAQQFLADWAPWSRFLVAIGAGAIGVVLAIFAQRIAFAVLGFYGGGFIALVLTRSTAGDNAQLAWFILAGLAGAIIAAAVMDWAIILLTSFAGASAIVAGLALGPAFQAVLLLILAALGIAIQSRGLKPGIRQRGPRGESIASQE